MKFTTILAAIVLSAVAVSALPCGHEGHHSNHEENHEVNINHETNINHEDNRNHEVNNNDEHKQIHQSIGSVGSSDSGSKGILGGILGGNILGAGILSKTTTNNYVTQNANAE